MRGLTAVLALTGLLLAAFGAGGRGERSACAPVPGVVGTTYGDLTARGTDCDLTSIVRFASVRVTPTGARPVSGRSTDCGTVDAIPGYSYLGISAGPGLGCATALRVISAVGRYAGRPRREDCYPGLCTTQPVVRGFRCHASAAGGSDGFVGIICRRRRVEIRALGSGGD